jgi:hypothetical protein
MKKLILIALVGMVLFSCKRKEYNYEIHGKVYIPTSGVNPMHDAIWYTDTINFDGDTIFYFNSDVSEVRIYPPYILKDKSN